MMVRHPAASDGNIRESAGTPNSRRGRLRVAVSLLAFFAVLAIAPHAARAHPHAWIDVKVKVLFDEKGRIYGLEETWVFDPLYTAFALDDRKRGKDKTPDQATIDA